MKIKFCGAATGVTGSCHLVSAGGHKILLDCGMFQGGKEMERMNRTPFPFDPKEIECVVISHAHIDHCGRLPLLVKRGFKGPVYATDATADLLGVMLRDSAHIHETDAKWDAKRAERSGREALEPLYTMADAEEAIKLVVPRRYDQLFELNDCMKVVFNEAGHILGSAIIELFVQEDGNTTKLVFSGDLGMPDRPILKDPKKIKKADVLIMETTYGGRLHESNQVSSSRLIDIAVKTSARGGNVIIPSFAVGRTQELLFELNKVYDGVGPAHEALKDVPVYVDSPMAAQATQVFLDNAQSYDDEAREYIVLGDHPLEFQNLRFVATSEESQRLNGDGKPKIILSASGMCDAGRIRHHLKHNLWDPKNSVVFVGYQAEGTLGRRLIEGEKTVTLFGEEIAVKAQIYSLEGFSGHADRDELYKWLDGFERQPGHIFLVHGEEESKQAFAEYVYVNKGWNCHPVEGFEEFDIKDGTVLEGDTPEQDFVSEEEVDGVRERISRMHDELEDILYSTTMAVSKELSPEKLTELKNTVADLEKEVLALGAVAASDELVTGDAGAIPPESAGSASETEPEENR
ncbi:MAG: MBL fold metallo-hydrolase [Firmicutes bacterium]|nr:MBL fold metallo-hydrolase [Bacillota bacterium]